MIRTRQVGGSQKNVTIEITGMVDRDVKLTPIETNFTGLKLKSVIWVVQEKLVFHLWWKEDFLIMPIESRNSARFDAGLRPPDDWNGKVWLQSYGFSERPSPPWKGFLIILDFDR